MRTKATLIEALVWGAARFAVSSAMPADPATVFVLRNNDVGDLLVVTPLFEALRTRFPKATIIAGVGSWNFPVLENNPFVSEIVPVNAPWHNQRTCPYPSNSFRGFLAALRYLTKSPEVLSLKALGCQVGIDVLGSPQGSLLLLRAAIPYRLGVKGYAGGHTAAQKSVGYNAHEHVGRSALRFAELLGATHLPPNRPQLFLTAQELEAGEKIWGRLGGNVSAKRLVIAPGGGFAAKRWPPEKFQKILGQLAADSHRCLALVGGDQDHLLADQIRSDNPRVPNLAGALSLRETFALVAAADLVLCNSSMLMHVAAAFSKPAVVVLGNHYSSASQHARQWGYPVNCWVLGKDSGRANIFEPAEVYALVARLLSEASPASNK